MGVYIKGLKMPRKDHVHVLVIHDDGRCIDEFGDVFPVTFVPPHGKLIDADALLTNDNPIGKMMVFGGEYVYAQTEIDNAPTIIEAEEGE